MSYANPIEERTGNYLSDHWQGNLSLPLSYWINGSLVQGATTGLIIAVQVQLAESNSSLQTASVVTITVTALAVAVWLWGAVGIWRSASKHVSRGGTAFWAGAAQAMIAIGALNTVGQLLKLAPQLSEYGQLAAGSDPIGTKAILAINGDTISLTGWIAAGTAEDFSEILNEHPEVRRLMLQSPGGRIRDARQIAAAVASRGLDTVATGSCNSACTIVFLSGKRRFAEVGSSLGFHSPSSVGMTDSEAQMANPEMRDAYAKAGLPSAFIDKVMATPSETVWEPNETELVEAGVISDFSAERIMANNRNAEQEINAATPKNVDQITTLMGAKTAGMELIYLYSLNVSSPQINRTAIAGLKAKTQNELCKSKVNKLLISSGSSFSYEYKDITGNIAARYTVNECSNAGST